MNLLKEENESKPFIIKSLLQDQNNLSNMGANFLLEQCKLQSFEFLRKISEEIPMDNCFSEGKRSTQVYSKERLNENPESKISSNNNIDFKMEPKIEIITKRKYNFNNTSKANNHSNNDKCHITNKDHVSNTNTSNKEKYKNKDNHKDKMNGKSTKERKRKQEAKETSIDQNTRDRKGKPIMFIMWNSTVKKLKDYLPTKKN